MTKGLVIDNLKSANSSLSTAPSPRIYALTALLNVANAVTSGLGSSNACDWPSSLSRSLINTFFVGASSTSPWLQSRALAVAVFNCLSTCLKIDKTLVCYSKAHS